MDDEILKVAFILSAKAAFYFQFTAAANKVNRHHNSLLLNQRDFEVRLSLHFNKKKEKRKASN